MKIGKEGRRSILNRSSRGIKKIMPVHSPPNVAQNNEEKKIIENQNFLSMNPIEYYNIFQTRKSQFEKIEIPKIQKINSYCDVLIVIPVRNRDSILETSLYFLNKEIRDSDFSIRIVVVEHDTSMISKETAENQGANYLFIKSNGEIFNKCLCHNLGSMIMDSKYVMFHDVDLIPTKNLFRSIFSNLGSYKAIQCFNDRRAIYVDQNNSEDFKKNRDIDSLANKSHRIGEKGAPGGSIMIERDLYERIGGFDHIFFWGYSIEDGFFWKKMEMYTQVMSCNNPPVEMYHLWHEPNHRTNPLLRRDHDLYGVFNRFSMEEKLKYLEIAKEEYKKLKDNVIF